MNYISHYQSPLGSMTMAADGTRLTGLWFDRPNYFADAPDPEHEERSALTVFGKTRQWLDDYFSGKVPDFTPPLLMRASEFRKRVWEVLLTIPYGHTMTYGEIARLIASERGLKTMSAQAVGGAVGHNDIALIIPCHRVIGAGGALTGYGAGIDKKIRLLQLEGIIGPDFNVPV